MSGILGSEVHLEQRKISWDNKVMCSGQATKSYERTRVQLLQHKMYMTKLHWITS